MRRIDNILSYIYPISIELTSSAQNPVLEIMLYCGKYSLNSENTNYSFGSLHTLFVNTFRRLNLDWNPINSVLILGFGTGSVAEIVHGYKSNCMIDGVEIDPKVLELGEKYFNTKTLKNVTIHCTSAAQYVNECHKKYDLIVIDTYVDTKVPEEVETEQFIHSLKNILNSQGMVVFNKFVNSKTSRNQLPLLKELYEKTFENIKVMTVMSTGKIFIAKKQSELQP